MSISDTPAKSHSSLPAGHKITWGAFVRVLNCGKPAERHQVHRWDRLLRQDKAPSERLSGVYVVMRDRELQAATSPLSVQQIILFWDSPRRSKN